jgi:hypothetical protein
MQDERTEGVGMKSYRYQVPSAIAAIVVAFFTILTLLQSGNARAAAGDTQPPTSPSQLHVTNNWGDCAFEFSWDGSTDDGSADIAYAFVVNGTLDSTYGWWWNTTHQTWGDCMAYPPSNGTYGVQVIARDPAGNVSQPSNTVTVTVKLWAE